MAIKYRTRTSFEPKDAIRVGSVRTFLDALEKLEKPANTALFYRGHSKFTYKLEPSIYRDPQWVANEDIMIKELILRCPNEFTALASTFQTLVKMQHYGLPTRLLDLTANPLIALYFACEPGASPIVSGEVLAFGVPTEKIKYYDSDTVSVISNVARRPATFGVPGENISKSAFNKAKEIRYLLHEIKQEKPYFEPGIVREHLESVICVRPKLENPRIIRQDGAFFLFGVNGTKSEPAVVPHEYQASLSSRRILIIDSERRKIRNQLESLGIFQATVYPEIDRVADFLKLRYATATDLS